MCIRDSAQVEEDPVLVPHERLAVGGLVRALAHHRLDRLGHQEGIDDHLLRALQGVEAPVHGGPVDAVGLGIALVAADAGHGPQASSSFTVSTVFAPSVNSMTSPGCTG